ncbi:MAG: 23S rRNA (adenine(2503)-C(2))-methyltransferase RlmN [Candidatus Sericytochromatia bacterium]|nr:23S rRNA (adenine(2503)-C(2))-methyltransferase RlmN [Candidatus Sericytochromatia bacterium]
MATPLVGMNGRELEAFFVAQGESAFRGRQVAKWIYSRAAREWSAMTDLSAAMRNRMVAEGVPVGPTTVEERHVSADGTTKFVLRLHDQQFNESVQIVHPDRLTACVSSQVGCAVGCPFCATGLGGFKRHLTPGEIVDQYLTMQHEAAGRISNIVFMGMGEPLLNTENVIAATHILNKEVNVGMRHITVSTSGIIPGIERLLAEEIPVNLAISLHAANDTLRDKLVPINKTYPLGDLIPLCKRYADTSNRRLTFEYVMLRDENDSPEQARELVSLLRGVHCHVNLIPHNPVDGSGLTASDAQIIRNFRDVVQNAGFTTTIRFNKGQDETAACGQLRGRLPARRKAPARS